MKTVTPMKTPQTNTRFPIVFFSQLIIKHIAKIPKNKLINIVMVKTPTITGLKLTSS